MKRTKETSARNTVFLARLLAFLTVALLVSVILLAVGAVHLSPVPLTVYFENHEVEYDGSFHSYPEYRLEGDLPGGCSLRLLSPTALTDIGSAPNEAVVRVINGRGQDVTDQFSLTVVPGVLTVFPRNLVLESPSVEKEYDGKWLRADEIETVFGTLVAGDRLQVLYTTSIRDAESVPNEFDVAIFDQSGRNVTSNYRIDQKSGQLTIKPYEIALKTEFAYKPYDGTPLTQGAFTVDRDPLPGHWMEVKVYGSQTEVGESPNYAEALIHSENENWDPEESGRLANNYHITYDFGTLLVQPPENGMVEGGGIDLTGDEGVGGGGGGEGGNRPAMIYVLSDYSGPIYLRCESFGEYNKSYFDDGIPYEDGYVNPLIYSGLAMREAGMEVHTVSVSFKYDEQLVPYYILDGFGNDHNDCALEQTDRVVKYTCVPFYSRAIREGTFTLPQAYQAEEAKYRSFVYGHYLDVPDYTREVLLQLAAENGLTPDSPTLIDDVANYIQHAARYDIYYAPDENDYAFSVPDSVVFFLTDIREGVCRHFAESAVMMFRTLGLPARYTVGFVGYCEAGKWTVIDPSQQGHAWVEVYINGCGWVQVEVTGSSEE